MGIRVEALGGTRVFRDGEVVPDYADKRKRFALLVLLAVEGDLAREDLLDLLWPRPDTGDASARGPDSIREHRKKLRHRLSQTLTQMHEDLGEGWCRRGQLHLHATAELDCDVRELEAAYERGDLATVTDLYGGEFLQGIPFRESRALERWRDEKGAELTRLVHDAWRKRVRDAGDDVDAALALAEEWASQDLPSVEADLTLMRLLARAGLRSQALDHLERHRERLPPGEEPDEELVRTAEAIREGAIPVEAPRSVGVGTERALASTRGVLVFPFEERPSNDRTRLVAYSLAEEIRAVLGRFEDLRVTPRTSSEYLYKQLDRGIEGFGLAELASEAGATHVIEGTVLDMGEGRCRARFSLCDPQPRVQDVIYEWSGELEPDSSSMDRRLEEIGESLDATLPEILGLGEPRDGRPRRGRREDPRAADAYRRGRLALRSRTEEGLLEALRLFEECLAEDEEYAPAYEGIANVHIVRGAFDYAAVSPEEAYTAAWEAASRAVELDPSLAGAHAALANTAMSYRWNWDVAREHFEEALEREHMDTQARQWYSHFLASRGDGEAALLQANIAVEFDRKSHFVYASRARTKQFLGSPQRALQDYEEATRLRPDYGLAHMGRALALQQTGDPRAALESLDAVGDAAAAAMVGRQGALALALRGYLLGVTGVEEHRTTAREVVLRELRERALLAGRDEDAPFFPPEYVALVYLGLDELDLAVQWLERALENRSTLLSIARVEPVLTPVRDHPRFVELWEEVQERAL